jgi:Na+-translocating ferredoxin:NAD+ oxidoreductase subunit C
VPAEHKIHTLIVNGCECEPYLTCDHRLMLEYPADLMIGIGWRCAPSAPNAPSSVSRTTSSMPSKRSVSACPPTGSITVQVVPTKYPQGAEKMLIKSLLNVEVPPGKLPMHVGVVVNNVGTLAQLGHLLPAGEGLTERVVTVTGPGIRKPGDYWVPIGTPMRTVLEWAGCWDADAREIILGGPMMGQAVASLDVPVTKGVSGILVFDKLEIEADRKVWPCIKCGECVKVCPMG